GDIEPDTIFLKDCALSVGYDDYLLGYHGTFSQTKGFVPIKSAALSQGKNYTVIDYVIQIDNIKTTGEQQFRKSDINPLLSFKDISSKEEVLILQSLEQSDKVLSDRIKAAGGINRFILKLPNCIPDLVSKFNIPEMAVLIHTIKPPHSPVLVVAALPLDVIPSVVSATCRFNPSTKVLLCS
uniref:hypothetical protein n=1 Tax=Yersinia aldovae TaxID=29483 RepID=UPI001643D189